MKDYRLSDRLLQVVDWIKPGGIVADIGTDHAYLPIYLVLHNGCNRAIALDVRKKPLERAKEHIYQFNVFDRVEIRLSNGMDELRPMEANVVTICGVGGKLMVDILKRGIPKIDSNTQLILSPQSELRLVRIFLYKNGIQIFRENMIKEDNQFYVIMDCKKDMVEPKNRQNKQYSDFEEMNFRYGKYLLESKNCILKEMLVRDKNVNLRILEQVTEAIQLKRLDKIKAEKRMQEICRDIKIIDMALDKLI